MLGERLALTRKYFGHTQDDLAEKLSVSIATVRSWERDISSPPHETLVKICRMYCVSSDYLLGLTDIDPTFVSRKRQEQFSPEELEQIREFENYLLWKKRNHTKKNAAYFYGKVPCIERRMCYTGFTAQGIGGAAHALRLAEAI